METIIRQGAFLLLFLASYCFTDTVRVDSKRTVKEVKKETKRQEKRNDAAEALFKSAERWVDVRELTGNNDHPMITKAMKLCGLDGDKGYAWCAAAQTEIHDYANVPAPYSARVVDWFVNNVVWKKEWGALPNINKKGMVGGLYYANLKRYGHIVLIVDEDDDNYYTLEGNTNFLGSREGDGFYKKIRRKTAISVLADYCLSGKLWFDEYENILKRQL